MFIKVKKGFNQERNDTKIRLHFISKGTPSNVGKDGSVGISIPVNVLTLTGINTHVDILIDADAGILKLIPSDSSGFKIRFGLYQPRGRLGCPRQL